MRLPPAARCRTLLELTRYPCTLHAHAGLARADKEAGPLLAVPNQLSDAEASAYSNGKIWEDGFNVQDGQGIPDCFSGHGRVNSESNDGSSMLVLGVGMCTGKSVDEFASTCCLAAWPPASLLTAGRSCSGGLPTPRPRPSPMLSCVTIGWEVTQATSDSYTFTTDHEFPGQEPMRLVRTVTLANRQYETHLLVRTPSFWLHFRLNLVYFGRHDQIRDPSFKLRLVFQWKNLHFLSSESLKNLDFLLKNLDFNVKTRVNSGSATVPISWYPHVRGAQ